MTMPWNCTCPPGRYQALHGAGCPLFATPLDAAKPTAPAEFTLDWPHGHITRDGRKARTVCTDAKGDQPIIALVLDPEDGSEDETRHCVDGSWALDHTPNGWDLINAPAPRRTKWRVWYPCHDEAEAKRLVAVLKYEIGEDFQISEQEIEDKVKFVDGYEVRSAQFPPRTEEKPKRTVWLAWYRNGADIFAKGSYLSRDEAAQFQFSNLWAITSVEIPEEGTGL